MKAKVNDFCAWVSGFWSHSRRQSCCKSESTTFLFDSISYKFHEMFAVLLCLMVIVKVNFWFGCSIYSHQGWCLCFPFGFFCILLFVCCSSHLFIIITVDLLPYEDKKIKCKVIAVFWYKHISVKILFSVNGAFYSSFRE